ncbi:MAG: hypothetical protein O3A92_16615 [Verrucomicrobia bacterium]|nr:hypothetical protein [Verrucomicrobiota bacterium]
MDRSFLSDESVVAASRNYVCVRAATYESEEEIPFLSSVFRGRSGALENTVFTLLAPDGKTKISRADRGPQMAFSTSDNAQIVKKLDVISKKHEVRNSETPDRLPFAADLRLGLNVAACDNQPLVICLAGDEESLRKIEKALAKSAWSEKHIGLFHYVSSNKNELADTITGLTIDSGLVIVQPDQFGTKAAVLVQHAVGDSSKTLADTLDAALAKFDRQPAGETRAHIQAGHRAGVHWDTATPVTDPVTDPGRPPAGGQPPR